MNRLQAFAISLEDNVTFPEGFKDLLREHKESLNMEMRYRARHLEHANFVQAGENDNRFVCWFVNPPIELFKYINDWQWLYGSVALWQNEQLITKENYKTVNYSEITNVAPIVDTNNL